MIHEMLDVLDLTVTKIKTPPGIPDEVIPKEIDFWQNFVNKCHKVKEEEILVKELQRHGFPIDRGPIAEMFEDHKKGRSILRRLVATGTLARADDQKQAFAPLAAAYSLYLYGHLHDEEEDLIRKANFVIEPARQEELSKDSEKLEEQVLGKGARERYLKLIEEVKSKLA